MNRNKIEIDVTPGYKLAVLDGSLVDNCPEYMTTEFFYPVLKGGHIECKDSEYVFAVATYSKEWEDKYIYTYDYNMNAAWVTYREDFEASFDNNIFVFEEDGFCRICVKRVDGQEISPMEASRINEILDFYTSLPDFVGKDCFVNEIEDTVEKVKSASDSCIGFCLLTDSHYTVNGTWDDTADNISKVVERLLSDECKAKLGGIIHLGDFTDGMTTRKVTSAYVKKMLNDLGGNGLPVYITLGNHDANYFRGNRQRFSKEEQRNLFGLKADFYYRDYDNFKIRCLFLSSYDIYTPVRYGFSTQEVKWVEKTLEETPDGYKVLVFAHEAPLDNLDFWARIIRNGREMMEVLESYNARPKKQILAYIHGHTHAEHVYRGSSFPIISIGCNKCEFYPDKKPEGSHAYNRVQGTVTQDLWDLLLVDAKEEKLHFIRFGAGQDRMIDCQKTESTWRMAEAAKKTARTTKIWANRGASGFAPENTLPAFEIAKTLNVDGIVLDVQMTKDGELVVIHDETIDRTGDGSGWIKDFTLEELRKFNFAKEKPSFGFVTIPTLREVYGMFSGTDYIINVELRTNRVAYGGIEEKVHSLSVEMGMEKQIIYSSRNEDSILNMQKFVTEEKLVYRAGSDWADVKGYGKVVWNVNEEADALSLREEGVAAIITNHPGKMRECFA